MASRVLQRSSNASFLRCRISLPSVASTSIGGVFSLSTPSLSSSSSVSSSVYRSRFYSPSLPSHRFFSSDASSSSSSDSSDDLLNSPRDSMNFDVLIVGGGPSGLATAIRLKQLAKENNEEISVCLIEKGSEIGAHILSGNVFETRSLDELLPNWKELGAPLHTEVKEDSFRFLINDQYSVPLPVPPPLHNEGNYIISLGALCRWLAQQAEALGVEIYPGFAASEVLYEEKEGGNISVAGVATADVGIGKDGKPKSTFQRGIELRASQTIFAEGARGSLSEKVMQKFNLRKDCDPQTYGIGFKEIWEIDTKINKTDAKKGRVMHTIGWPVGSDIWGGSFMYHMEDNKILLGYVIGLDYSNPYVSPYQEFQRWKTHPSIKKYLEGGKCVSYGARVINEGGYQSIPKLSFPGGLLVGCSAGLLNVPKIKGSHTAMKSGIVAAEAIFDQYKRKTHPIFGDAQKNKTTDTSSESSSSEEEKSPFSILASDEILSFENNLRNSWVGRELYSVRNYHPVFQKFGFYAFLPYGALSGYLFKGSEPWTFRNHKTDAQKTKPAAECQIIDYPKPDNIYSFDLLLNLQRSGVSHNDDQPPHLKIKPDKKSIADSISYEKFAGPESRFCPAKVYEYIPSGQIDPITKKEKMKLSINFTNCIHCKTCAIKTPEQFIEWTVPEGGGGPKYAEM